MAKTNYIFEQTAGVPLMMWTRGIDVADEAKKQLKEVAGMPFIFKHLAVMPDVHVGKGATIGSVIPTLGAVMPSAVGVDIGCGMYAAKTNLKAQDLPCDLAAIRKQLENNIPHGRSDHGLEDDKGAFKKVSPENKKRWNDYLSERYKAIIEKHPRAYTKNAKRHLGTLGGGNHFIEVCLDGEDNVWFMIHSGSRGAGNKLGSHFIGLAQKEMDRYFVSQHLPNKDLAYLVEGTEVFKDYIEAVLWAQDYALHNRSSMMEAMVKVMKRFCPQLELTDEQVNCHHNFVRKESHFGENIWVTRKGAVCVREGMLGIIPGSMGAQTFIVEGTGSQNSFCSCSHGAGRAMSRAQARKRFTVDDHIKAMEGIEARTDEAVLDETPMAYKPITDVMKAQSDLVTIQHELRQIINIKG